MNKTAELTEEQTDAVVEWCHRWACSRGTDDYCGCSFDHLDRDMAYRLMEEVIEPIVSSQRADEKSATLRAVTSQLHVEQIQDPSIYNIWQRVHICVTRAQVEGEL